MNLNFITSSFADGLLAEFSTEAPAPVITTEQVAVPEAPVAPVPTEVPVSVAPPTLKGVEVQLPLEFNPADSLVPTPPIPALKDWISDIHKGVTEDLECPGIAVNERHYASIRNKPLNQRTGVKTLLFRWIHEYSPEIVVRCGEIYTLSRRQPNSTQMEYHIVAVYLPVDTGCSTQAELKARCHTQHYFWPGETPPGKWTNTIFTLGVQCNTKRGEDKIAWRSRVGPMTQHHAQQAWEPLNYLHFRTLGFTDSQRELLSVFTQVEFFPPARPQRRRTEKLIRPDQAEPTANTWKFFEKDAQGINSIEKAWLTAEQKA